MASFRFATSFSTSSGTAVFVPCGIALLNEVNRAVELGLLRVTNLGQLGDVNHGSTSRHSPHWYNGRLYICAVDFGGLDYAVMARFFQYLYKKHDPRVYAWGFAQLGDGNGIRWTDGEWTWTGKDQGHSHLDFAMADRSIGGQDDRSWWVDGLNDTSPWGLIEWLQTGGITNDSIMEDFDVPFSQWPQSEKDALASYFWGGIKIKVGDGYEAPAVTLAQAVNRTVSQVNTEAGLNRNRLATFVRDLPAKSISDEQLATLAATVVTAINASGASLTNEDIARVTAALITTLASQPVTLGGSK